MIFNKRKQKDVLTLILIELHKDLEHIQKVIKSCDTVVTTDKDVLIQNTKHWGEQIVHNKIKCYSHKYPTLKKTLLHFEEQVYLNNLNYPSDKIWFIFG